MGEFCLFSNTLPKAEQLYYLGDQQTLTVPARHLLQLGCGKPPREYGANTSTRPLHHPFG